MQILNSYARFLILAFIAAIMTACGSGSCQNPADSAVKLGTLPNG